MAIELEKIKSWDGQSGTGADNRGVIDRNFEKVKMELGAIDTHVNTKFNDVEEEINQLAGDLSLKVRNLITNGDFANDVNGWSGTGVSVEHNSGRLRAYSWSVPAHRIISPTMSDLEIGDLLYLRIGEYERSVIPASSNIIAARINDTTPYIIYEQNNPNLIIRNLSGVAAYNGETPQINIRTYQGEGNSVWIDDVVCINLTKSFGAGNEPTKEQMDALMDIVGYFDGDSISRNQLMRWLLESQQQSEDKIYGKANHGYASLEEAKTLKEVDDRLSDVNIFKLPIGNNEGLIDANGEIQAFSGWNNTGKIEIVPGAAITYRGSVRNSGFIAFYDIRERFIESIEITQSTVVTEVQLDVIAPDNAAYINATYISVTECELEYKKGELSFGKVFREVAESFKHADIAKNEIYGIRIGEKEGYLDNMGVAHISGNWKHTGIFTVMQGVLTFRGALTSNTFIVFYDINGVVVHATTGSALLPTLSDVEFDIEIPTNAVFMNASYFGDVKPEITYKKIDSLADAALKIEEIKSLENYVFANELEVAVDTNPNNWVKDEIYIGSNYEYPGGVRSVEEKDKLVELKGGKIYICTIPVISSGASCSLFDDNMNRLNNYSIANGRASRSGDFIKFKIDLTNVSKSHYLSISTAFDRLDEVRISNAVAYKIGASSGNASVTKFDNNLKSQLASFSDIGNIESGSYGQIGSIYNITADYKRLSVDFSIKANIHDNIGEIPFMKMVDSSSNEHTIGINHISPSLEKVKVTPGGERYYYTANPVLKASFYAGSESRLITRDKSVGDIFFMIWFKGAKQLTYPTTTELKSRSTYLSGFQDLYIEIDNDQLTIGRDGRDSNNELFNGGEMSTIYQTSLKSGEIYKTVQALYAEMSTSPLLSDFYFEFFNLSSRATCEELLQFGKIRLVDYYEQQVTIDTGNTDVDYGYYYDSFPCYIFNHTNSTYTYSLDLIKKESTTDVYIDGIIIGSVPNGSLSIHNNGVLFENLEIYNKDLGDAEIFNDSIISKKTPNIQGLMLHGFVDTIEGDIASGSISVSYTRMADVCRLLKERGYTVYSLEDIYEYFCGRKEISKRSAYFVADDNILPSGFWNKKNMQAYQQYGVPVNFALTHNQYSDIPEKILQVQLNGNTVVCHSRFHDVSIQFKNSLILYAELKETQVKNDELYLFNKVYVYAWGAGYWFPSELMLKINGYYLGIHSDQYVNNTNYDVSTFTSKYYNRFKLGRQEAADKVPFSVLESILL